MVIRRSGSCFAIVIRGLMGKLDKIAQILNALAGQKGAPPLYATLYVL